MTPLSGLLARILDAKRDEVAARRRARSLESLEEEALRVGAVREGGRRDFREALRGPGVSLIAEVKRRSPSAGALRDGEDLTSIARNYEAGGARALSVLTDAAWFGALDGDLPACRAATRLPVLRKDFLIDPYQLVESCVLGADAVLLIAAALPGERLAEMVEAAARWRRAVLLEVHDEAELARALPFEEATLGINNRDLANMTTDLSVTERLAPLVPAGRTLVSESGIETRADVRRLAAAGVRAFLVGAALLRAEDPALKVRELAGALA